MSGRGHQLITENGINCGGFSILHQGSLKMPMGEYFKHIFKSCSAQDWCVFSTLGCKRELSELVCYFLPIITLFDISRRSINCLQIPWCRSKQQQHVLHPSSFGENISVWVLQVVIFTLRYFNQVSGIPCGIWGWASRSEEPDHELSVAMVIYLPTCAKTSQKVLVRSCRMQLLVSKGQVTIWVTFKIKEQKYLC